MLSQSLTACVGEAAVLDSLLCLLDSLLCQMRRKMNLGEAALYSCAEETLMRAAMYLFCWVLLFIR